MKKTLLLTVFLLTTLIGYGQDNYHIDLQSSFQTTYQIPLGDWVFFDNEDAILSTAGNYGGAFSIKESANTNFSKVVSATIASPGANPWDAGWSIRNQRMVNAGDKVLIIFSIRSIGGKGKVNIFAENADDFSKEVFLSVDVSEEWTHYSVPFESVGSYNVNSMTFGFHLANLAQTIEIGGFTAMNFSNKVSLDDLPSEVNNDQYDGFEADAPWRSTAAENIDKFRKADLNIQVNNVDGTPVKGAKVTVKMVQHDFAFGSAVNADKIAGNNKQNNIYESKITDLDGKGHGFNWVVFENDMKWPAWEQNWLVTPPELANAVQWLRARGIQIRGHTLVWPGESNMPNDIKQNRTNLPYIRERIDNHLEEILTYPDIKGEVAEWDVLNEITTNISLEQYFGNREILADIFKKTHEIDPNTGLWLNDYVTISTNSKPGNGNYDNLKLFTRELIDAGVELEGIGFQGHIGGFPNGIPSVLETLDDFHNEFGLKAKITEFDMPNFVDAETAAQYLGDFLTAIFSHESMNGFLFWSFWDGATWIEGGTQSNFFQENWIPNPSLGVFTDLVFDEWWTNEVISSTEEGNINTRVFKGMYEISYESDGEIISDTLNITADTDFKIMANNVTTSFDDLVAKDDLVEVYPNPAVNHLFVEKQGTAPVVVQLFDITGKLILEQQMNTTKTMLLVDDLRGIYLLKIFDDFNIMTKKITIK